jgi:TRAP-type C4-dicarboxylate transport system permease small subunit
VSMNRVDGPGSLVAVAQRVVDKLNKLLLALSMLAMVLTACVLTYAVVTRYFLKMPTDWQDDASVFMLIGVSFCCATYVQSMRGHIGIDVLASILPVWANRLRMLVVDLVSFLFCAFFSWKSWTLFYEALAEGQTTNSTFAPPLWIPYSMMAFGMSLLTLQLLLQVLARLLKADNRSNTGAPV